MKQKIESFVLPKASRNVFPLTNKLVSSANNFTVALRTQFSMSLTYSKKSRGPSIEPCGTPYTSHYVNRIYYLQLRQTAVYCLGNCENILRRFHETDKIGKLIRQAIKQQKWEWEELPTQPRLGQVTYWRQKREVNPDEYFISESETSINKYVLVV